MPNAEMLAKTLQHIKDINAKRVEMWTSEPAQETRVLDLPVWDQHIWLIWRDAPDEVCVENMPCGTAGCFAGWAVILDGRSVLERKRAWFFGEPLFKENAELGWPEENITDRAGRILGLEEDQAQCVFNPGNDMQELEELVKVFSAPE